MSAFKLICLSVNLCSCVQFVWPLLSQPFWPTSTYISALELAFLTSTMTKCCCVCVCVYLSLYVRERANTGN